MRYLKSKNMIIVVLICLCITIVLGVNQNVLYTYTISPLFWIIVITYIMWNSRNLYVRSNGSKKYVKYIIAISIINIVTYFYIGFIFGFSKNPYSQDLLIMLKNVLIKIIPITSIELTRSILATRNKNNKIFLFFLTIIMTLIEINYHVLINVWTDKEILFKYICSNVLPIIGCSILYTYLTLKGSLLIVLIYRFSKDLVFFLVPILPDIDWFVTGTISILNTVIIYILFKYGFIKERKDIRKRKKDFSEKVSYIIILFLLITLVCFMLGFFKYEPIAILSNSMVPTYSRGDVVIYKKLSESELTEIPKDSVIIYRIGNQNVAHRVIERIKKKNSVLYRTKGDKNNIADSDLVKIEQILGVYVFRIVYIGFPSVWLHDYFIKEKVKIETK